MGNIIFFPSERMKGVEVKQTAGSVMATAERVDMGREYLHLSTSSQAQKLLHHRFKYN